MNQYESVEEIEIAITSDLQRIDVHLASIVSVVTGIHRATQQYTQAIRSASQHLQTWTQFFAGYRPAEPLGSSTENASSAVPVVQETPNEADFEERSKENHRPQFVSPEILPLESGFQINKSDRPTHLTPQLTSPLISSKPKSGVPLSLGLTPDLKSPLLTSKKAAASEATPRIESSSKTPDMSSTTCNRQIVNSRLDQCLQTPDFSSPPFRQTLNSPQFNIDPNQARQDAVTKSSLDLSFISSVKSDSPRRLPSDRLPEFDGSDLDQSISFSVPKPSTRKLADIGALINQDTTDSFSLQSEDDEIRFKTLLEADRSSLLDFSKLPSIYRSGYAQKQIMEVFNCFKSTTQPLSLQSLVKTLDQSEGMITLMIDTLHQKGFIRAVFEDGGRRWVIS